MIYIILFLFITILSVIIIYKYFKNKSDIYIQYLKEEYISTNRQKLEEHIRRECEKSLREKAQLESDIKIRTEEFDRINQQVQQVNATLNQSREETSTMIQSYERDMSAAAEERVKLYMQRLRENAIESFNKTMHELNAQMEQAAANLAEMSAQIEAYSAKQAAINEAILRQRELDEQQDFYRVCLAPDTANDVEVLNAARRNLKKPEIIDKIIYDNYIAKPVLEMIKRVLQNTTCSGIYKITCTKTGEIYIGKSTDIKNRWQQHCKTVFNCGTIASSLLHTKMKQHGIENFTFELVEKVPKEQLTEREKFYINFYQTKEVGLNERNG